MGYSFHITRAAHWIDSDQSPITSDEWLSVVKADPELTIATENGEFFAEWPGPCRYPGGTWFDWSNGQVETKNPDQAILGKMLHLAERLGGIVQGDDGEIYRSLGDWR